MTIINKSVHSEISCMNYRYIIDLFIKTIVIFRFILLKGNFTERTSENLKFSIKMLVKIKNLESCKV